MTHFNIFSKRTDQISGIDIYGAKLPEDITVSITYDPFNGPQCTFTNKTTGSAKSIPTEHVFDLIVVPVKNKRRTSFKRFRMEHHMEHHMDPQGDSKEKRSCMNMTKVTLDCPTMFSYRVCVDRLTYSIMAVKKHSLVTVATIHYESDDHNHSGNHHQNNPINNYSGLHTDLMFDLEL